MIHKLTNCLVAFMFIFSMAVPASIVEAQGTVLNLPLPGTIVTPSHGYVPALIKGITVHQDNPLMFDFIVDTGDSGLEGLELKEESIKLIKYFLAGITIPDEELWVNLSPYEKDRIVPEGLGQTELGRDMLAQDYMLKQLTASLMNPSDELGSRFWDRVYKKAQEVYGTTDVPLNTFNKIWIVPRDALVYQNGNKALVVNSHLSVMLEEDYIALQNNLGVEKHGLDSVVQKDAEIISGVASEIVRNILIPEIEKEVNQGKNFAALRQIYNSMILAVWYKEALRDSLLGQVYANKNKISGVDVEDKQIKQKIYEQYLEAFKKGVFEKIEEDYDPQTQQVVLRKYFSGGMVKPEVGITTDTAMLGRVLSPNATGSNVFEVTALGVENVDKAAHKFVTTGKYELPSESQKIYDGYTKVIDAVREHLPGAVFMPGFSRKQIDTRVDKDDPDSDREMALDPYFPEHGGTVIAISEADPRDAEKYPGLGLSLVRFPVAFEKDNIPPEIQELVEKSKDGKTLSGAVESYLREKLREADPNFPFETRSKTRSETRGDIIERGDSMEYINADNIFVETGDGRIIGWLPFWIKRDEEALYKLERAFAKELSDQKAKYANSEKAAMFLNERESWSIEAERQLGDGENPLDILSANTHNFIEEFFMGNTEEVDLLKKLIGGIKADDVINYERYGIEFDDEFSRNRSKFDMDFDIPGYGNNLMLHLVEKVSLDLLLRFMDSTIMPEADSETRVGKAIEDEELQSNAVSLYYKLYHHLLDQGESVGVAEASRIKVGKFATKLNDAIREEDAIDINEASALDLVKSLEQKGVALKPEEKESIIELIGDGGVWAFNIMQLAEALESGTFIKAFRHIKIVKEKHILPSQKPNPVFKGGAGDISSTVFMGRITSDIKLRDEDPGYVGKFSVQTRGLKDADGKKILDDEKPGAAVALVSKMFGDKVVRTASDLTVDGKHISEMFDDGDIELRVGKKKAYSALDKIVKTKIDSTYVVDIVMGEEVIGSVYVTETVDFKNKMRLAENQKEAMKLYGAADFVPEDRDVTEMDNVPDPLMVITEDGEEIFFGDISDGTPGGTVMGDLNVTKDEKGKYYKATTWQQFAVWAIDAESEEIGGAAEEAARAKGIIAQTNRRIGGENLIVDSEQIYSKLVMLMGGGFHMSGENTDKTSYLKDGRVLFFSPTSCSTTGNNFITQYESVVFGFGRARKLLQKVRDGEIDLKNLTTMLGANDVINTISKAMPTAHAYTGSDVGGDKIPGGERPGGTGAAKGGEQHGLMSGFAAGDRVPTGVKNGEVPTPGGSMYDMIVEYPGNISEKALVKMFLRAEIGDPNAIAVAKPTIDDNGFEWKYAIGGKQVGSIIVKVEKLYGNLFRIRVAYDNVMGFAHENAVLHESLAKLRIMQKETERRQEVIKRTGDKAMLASPVKQLIDIPQSELKGKVVAIREDFNVPLDEAGNITDDTRIKAGLNTIRYAIDAGAKVILTSHLGRPEGKVLEEFSLKHIIGRLNELLGEESNAYFSPEYDTMRRAKGYIDGVMKEGDVLLLENTRFNPTETSAEHKEYAEALYEGADLFVLDGFSVAHRPHASVVGAAELGIPSVAGFLVSEEVNGLEDVLQLGDVIVMGGAKVTDKIQVIENLLAKKSVKKILIGGAMVNAFFAAQGKKISGNNLGVSEEDIAIAEQLLGNEKIVLPTDVIVAGSFDETAENHVVNVDEIGVNDIIVDIGPETAAAYSRFIEESELPFGNGPMGAFDKLSFAEGGTKAVITAIALAEGSIGGGDSIAAMNRYLTEDQKAKFGYVSRAGGATLETLRGNTLPGIASLDKPLAGDEFVAADGSGVGGINLNPALLNLQIRRDDNGVALSIGEQPIETMNIDGILPVIIRIAPINHLFSFK